MTVKETKIKEVKKSTSHVNRGMKFEKVIQNKCDKLRAEGIALISKVPTDWVVTRIGGRIVSGFPRAESCFVDFIGIYKEKAFALECKETKNKTSFPFSNIKDTQIEFLDKWTKLGGLGYYIIRFETNKKVFLISSDNLHKCINTIDRKSVPYGDCLESEDFIEIDYKKLDFENYIETK